MLHMSSRNLNYLLAPRCIALVGASDRPQSIGATVMRNLIAGGFAGPIWPVNLRHSAVAGTPVFAPSRAFPAAPELAMICTPAPTVPGLIAELGERGACGGGDQCGARCTPRRWQPDGGDAGGGEAAPAAHPRSQLRRAARARASGSMRASRTRRAAGKLAFVSQSGALTTAVLDWAKSRGIGFSHLVSLGDGADVDFGDMLDYLASDPRTRAILLYIEGDRAARKFMSAARAAARNKPVIAVKAGRVAGRGARRGDAYRGARRSRRRLRRGDSSCRHAARRDDGGSIRSGETLARHRSRCAVIASRSSPTAVARASWRSTSSSQPADDSPTFDVDRRGSTPCCRPRGRAQSGRHHRRCAGRAIRQRRSKQLLADSRVDAALLIHAPTAIVPSADIARRLVPIPGSERNGSGLLARR